MTPLLATQIPVFYMQLICNVEKTKLVPTFSQKQIPISISGRAPLYPQNILIFLLVFK